MPILTINAEGQKVERYSVNAAQIVLGRGTECAIRLKDIQSSRQHFQLVKTNQGYKVVDLGSGNGTFVNGVEIKEQLLKPGDVIQIGTTSIEYQEAPPKGAAAQKGPKPQTARTPTTRTPTGKVPAIASKPTQVVRRPAGAAPAKPTTGQVRKPTQVVKKATTQNTRKVAKGGTQVTRKVTQRGTQATKKVTTRTKKTTRSVAKDTGKAGTGRMTRRGGTGRMSTRRTGRVSKTERFTRSAHRPKKNPLVVALVLCVLGLGGFLAFYFIQGSGPDPEQILEDYETLQKQARMAEGKGDYGEAVALWEQVVAFVDKLPPEDQMRERPRMEMARDEAKDSKKSYEEVEKKVAEFDRAMKDEEYRVKEKSKDSWGLMKEWHTVLMRRYKEHEFLAPLVKTLENYQPEVDRKYDEEVKAGLAKTWVYFNQEYVEPLMKESPKQYGPAVLKCREFLALEDISADHRAEAEKAVKDINNRANTEIYRLKNKSKDVIKKAMPRFKGCDKYGDLEAAVK